MKEVIYGSAVVVTIVGAVLIMIYMCTRRWNDPELCRDGIPTPNCSQHAHLVIEQGIAVCRCEAKK